MNEAAIYPTIPVVGGLTMELLAPERTSEGAIQAAHPLAYQVLQILPPAYEHAQGLTELAESITYGLRRAGFTVYYREPPRGSARTIVIGAHLLDADAVQILPPDTIIFNTEQIQADSPWLTASYLEILRTHWVWDYSAENVRRLRDLGVDDIEHVPLGYVPELSRIAPSVEDIDVLFYGSVNPRRKAIIDELQRRGLNVVALFGKYGEERDRAIARSKVVLNMHFYDAKVFEIVRAFYLLTNFKAVVAECGEHTAVESDLREAVRGVPYDQLVDACVDLVRDDAARHALRERGHAVFARRRAEDILAAVLQIPSHRAAISRDAADAGLVPLTLNLGSGKDFRSECLNVDISSAWKPDAVIDIAGSAVVGVTVQTQRFGAVALEEGRFDAIIANDVLEHVPNLTSEMTNCLRLLRPGGLFHIVVPYDLSLGAWQDPTHVRAFNENSWLYYTDWHWYLGWIDMRFDIQTMQFHPSAFGEELIRAGKSQAEIVRTPRAVDSLRVVLRKRYAHSSERQEAMTRQPGRH